jgi:hypothetical protein
MASGDVKQAAYPASANLTTTNLQSLASSATHVAGWESALIDNTSNLYLDYRITAKIVVGAAPTAGLIRMWLVDMLDDSTWHDVFDGTESTETVTSVEIRDSICQPAAITATDATGSRVYPLSVPSVKAIFGGNMPAKFVIFVTHSTVQALAAAGSQVTVKGSFGNVAP